MPLAEKLPFRKIPGHTKIFLEYLDQTPGALRFYQHSPSLAGLEKLIREDPPDSSFSRREMPAILRRQNASIGCGEQTEKNIAELERQGCVAVLTGQQVGLFTGPLYTIYKALTAIRIVEELSRRGIRAVPVFWMECEDHDLPEVTHNTVLASDSSARKLDFLNLLFGDSRDSARPVGSRHFPESIRQATAEYSAFLPKGEYRQEIQAMLEAAWAPGAEFADAFGRLMAELFRQWGLIFFNPSDAEAKRLAASVFRKALIQNDEIYGALRERNRSIEANGFHTQVSVPEHSTVLFFQEEGERRAVIRRDARFALRNAERSFTPEELLGLCEMEPERFSPNVLLRPIVQDHLFPTAAYVGGPAEVAYYAQIEVLYRLYGRSMPVIWPRSSFTLLEPEIASAMNQAGVEFEDCLQGKQSVLRRLVEAARRPGAAANLKALGEMIQQTLQAVRPEMVAADASLASALETAQRKMLHHIQSLQGRFVQLEARQDGALEQKAEAICSHCFPNKSLQERELGLPSFLARHGRGLLDTIYERINPDEFAHQIITLK